VSHFPQVLSLPPENTRDHYLRDTSRPDWLVRFPMVKASLRAMDAMTEFVAQVHPELGCQLDYYIVSGASKRGWTTWDVGAVDPKR
jgi:PhoPQ-activated pathogenicity-related protein